MQSKVAWYRCRESGMSVGEICELFGMSRRTYCKWYKSYQEEGIAGLGERSRRPKRNLALCMSAHDLGDVR